MGLGKENKQRGVPVRRLESLFFTERAKETTGRGDGTKREKKATVHS